MRDKIIIYGTNWCPHCTKARMAYGERAVYIDAEADVRHLDEMLIRSGGEFRVPVIAEGARVTIGFGGESRSGFT